MELNTQVSQILNSPIFEGLKPANRPSFLYVEKQANGSLIPVAAGFNAPIRQVLHLKPLGTFLGSTNCYEQAPKEVTFRGITRMLPALRPYREAGEERLFASAMLLDRVKPIFAAYNAAYQKALIIITTFCSQFNEDIGS